MKKGIAAVVATATVVGLAFLAFIMFGMFGVKSEKTDTERFYGNKEALSGSQDAELENLLKTAYAEAVENEGIEIQEHFLSTVLRNSSWDNTRLRYHVLTTEGEYIVYSIDTPSTETLFWALYNGRDSDYVLSQTVEQYCELIPDNIYYLEKGRIKLQQ